MGAVAQRVSAAPNPLGHTKFNCNVNFVSVSSKYKQTKNTKNLRKVNSRLYKLKHLLSASHVAAIASSTAVYGVEC